MTTPARRVAGVVLAAGGSRRLGVPKQLLRDLRGETLVARMARQLLDAGCHPVIVVTGAEPEAVTAAIEPLPVMTCFNADWAEGMGASIRCAIRWLEGDAAARDLRGVLIAPCDMPSITTAHLTALLDESGSGTRRVASAYAPLPDADPAEWTEGASGVRGIPAYLPRADWTVLGALSGDRGARDLLRAPGTLSVFLRGGSFDLDTPTDVARWRAESLETHPPTRPMSSTIAQHGLVDLDAEIANTRRVLERVPADHLEFTPHAKSWPLRRVAKHLTDFGGWGSYTLQSDGIDFAQPFPPGPPDPTDAAGFLKLFDEGMDGFKAALATATDEQMLATWTIRNGDVVLSTQSRAATLRSMVMNHMIHHRAQLTIYLRLLGVPVPGLYGPSADEGGN